MLTLNGRRFEVTTTSLNWVLNDERSSCFLVLHTAKPPDDALNRLLRACNVAAQASGQRPLYSSADARPIADDDARASDYSAHFHLSIAWTLEAPSTSVLARTQSADVKAALSSLTTILRLSFESVKVKMGNIITPIPLSNRTEAGPAFFGG